jgi:hypothetical protein
MPQVQYSVPTRLLGNGISLVRVGDDSPTAQRWQAALRALEADAGAALPK